MTGERQAGDNSSGQLRLFVERIEKLEEERGQLAADIKEVYAEAKGSGFNTKIMRKIIAERRKDADDLNEEQMLLELYRKALANWDWTPLGNFMEEAAK